MALQDPVFVQIPHVIGFLVASLTAGTFIIYSYKYQHDDGRVSYPLCFIFSSPAGKSMPSCQFLHVSLWLTRWFPAGCRPEQQMMYAGSKNKLVHTVQLSKVSELQLLRITIKFFSDSELMRQKAETTFHSGVFCRCLRSETRRT